VINCRVPSCCTGLLFLAACGGSSDVPGFSRETAPDGRGIVTYASGLGIPEDTLVTLFEIGRYTDDSSAIFEDLRDLAIDSTGRIHALDARAREIRVFDNHGALDTILGRAGEGPGEFSQVNGLRFGPEGTLWVNDHGKRSLLALDREGRERARHTSIVPGFGYRWNVMIDSAGMMWEPWSSMVAGPEPDMEASGLVEGNTLMLYRTFDPTTDARDSVSVTPAAFRSWRASYSGGQMVTGLPFAPRPLMTIDSRRRVWVAPGETYSLIRMNTDADTTLEVRVTEAGVPVSEGDIAEWEAGFADFAERAPTLLRDLKAYMPTHKPPLLHLFTDDADRLWVGRTVPEGSASQWDVFSSEGDLLGVVRGPTATNQYMPPVVMGGRIYLMVEGEAGERYIVVAEVPRMRTLSGRR
jgi:hypothetical protein